MTALSRTLSRLVNRVKIVVVYECCKNLKLPPNGPRSFSLTPTCTHLQASFFLFILKCLVFPGKCLLPRDSPGRLMPVGFGLANPYYKPGFVLLCCVQEASLNIDLPGPNWPQITPNACPPLWLPAIPGQQIGFVYRTSTEANFVITHFHLNYPVTPMLFLLAFFSSLWPKFYVLPFPFFLRGPSSAPMGAYNLYIPSFALWENGVLSSFILAEPYNFQPHICQKCVPSSMKWHVLQPLFWHSCTMCICYSCGRGMVRMIIGYLFGHGWVALEGLKQERKKGPAVAVASESGSKFISRRGAIWNAIYQ